jgi:hypothetical protein
MQIITMIGQVIESGKVTLSTKNKESIEIIAVNKKIDVNLKDKDLIKDLILSVRKGSKNICSTETVKESPKMVKAAKSMRETLIDTANELKQAGITITLSYKADVVATVGAQASAGISRLVTGTKAIEINSLPKLVELGIYES